MEEAIEICKLRLFLKLVAQVERVNEIEPLPDIDFNVKAGNTLVGFVDYEQVKRAVTSDPSYLANISQIKMFTDEPMRRIEEKAVDVDRLFALFRQQQTEIGGEVTAEDKQELLNRLKILEDELNRYLAGEYGVDPEKKGKYEKWLATHKPFHWFIEFYGIMKKGGFDVIIGNPPYVEYSKVKREYNIQGYATEKCGNLYAFVMERSLGLLHTKGQLGIIVPISSVTTPRMEALLIEMSQCCGIWHSSNYAVRPGKLFIGADMNLTIHLAQKGNNQKQMFSTNYRRWYNEGREDLFQTLSYESGRYFGSLCAIPKFSTSLEEVIWNKIHAFRPCSLVISKKGKTNDIYYHSGGRYFRKCLLNKLSNEYKPLIIPAGTEHQFIALLSSNLYYWYWIIVSDTYHVTRPDIEKFPLPESVLSDMELKMMGEKFYDDLWKNAIQRKRNRKDGTIQVEVNFLIGKSKPIIDEIDQLLARHYGFTEKELDFIINYDIKYRMGIK